MPAYMQNSAVVDLSVVLETYTIFFWKGGREREPSADVIHMLVYLRSYAGTGMLVSVKVCVCVDMLAV